MPTEPAGHWQQDRNTVPVDLFVFEVSVQEVHEAETAVDGDFGRMMGKMAEQRWRGSNHLEVAAVVGMDMTEIAAVAVVVVAVEEMVMETGRYHYRNEDVVSRIDLRNSGTTSPLCDL
jgi:hypothetical protein